ncbi:hypothetical protein [Streptomyces sp. NPDC091278]|uniref:hypothetical protein n=1 Tax=Streptomyces sp. NPDC091278 TaxID=3155301 RepID=UPI00344DA6D1
MMPQAPRPRVCFHCDGFPVVHITTGTTSDGRRRTLAAACPACEGTGHITPAALARVGK